MSRRSVILRRKIAQYHGHPLIAPYSYKGRQRSQIGAVPVTKLVDENPTTIAILTPNIVAKDEDGRVCSLPCNRTLTWKYPQRSR